VNSFQLREPINLLKYQDLTLEGRDYCAAYADYWNASAEEDGQYHAPFSQTPSLTLPACQGQIVDAAIMPVAPHAAVIPGQYYHTGNPLFSWVCRTFANVFQHTPKPSI
jgi:amidase